MSFSLSLTHTRTRTHHKNKRSFFFVCHTVENRSSAFICMQWSYIEQCFLCIICLFSSFSGRSYLTQIYCVVKSIERHKINRNEEQPNKMQIKMKEKKMDKTAKQKKKASKIVRIAYTHARAHAHAQAVMSAHDRFWSSSRLYYHSPMKANWMWQKGGEDDTKDIHAYLPKVRTDQNRRTAS